MKYRNSFTVIELLMVITIILVLAALLLPSLGKAKAKARTVQCSSNQHQIFLSLHLYLEDNEGFLPIPYDQNAQWATWPKRLIEANYCENGIMFCPQTDDYPAESTGAWGWVTLYLWSKGRWYLT